ncbi:Seems to be required for maximal rate of protein biosynthesis [Parahypoxylon ruwenzoriense]
MSSHQFSIMRLLLGIMDPLRLREEGEEYAIVDSVLGENRFTVRTLSMDPEVRDKSRTGIVRGRIRGKNCVGLDSVVLISLRGSRGSKADIIHRYSGTEVERLMLYGQIPDDCVEKRAADDCEDDSGDEDWVDVAEDFLSEDDSEGREQ